MTVEDKEINGFLIDQFNQHNLEVGKTQGIALTAHTLGNLRIRSLNVLLMIGNVVSEHVITVTPHFNYIPIKEKVTLRKLMLCLLINKRTTT